MCVYDERSSLVGEIVEYNHLYECGKHFTVFFEQDSFEELLCILTIFLSSTIQRTTVGYDYIITGCKDGMRYYNAEFTQHIAVREGFDLGAEPDWNFFRAQGNLLHANNPESTGKKHIMPYMIAGAIVLMLFFIALQWWIMARI